MEDRELKPGEQFCGYIVEKSLGHGAIGAVYLVRHAVTDTCYALKLLDPAVARTNPVYVKRFLQEARLATRIRHPNLVCVHDCGKDAERNVYYIVMDYVEGGTLREALAFSGRFDVARAADVVAQVASALSAARPFRMVHRDIKPENVMIRPDGSVKLVDLGIAKAKNIGESVGTNTRSIFGTPAYISPEQAQCAASVDERADVYSLGIVFYEMLAGRSPYGHLSAGATLEAILSDVPTPDIRDAVPDVPSQIAVLVRRMTVKDRERRLASCDDVLAELVRLGYVEAEAETGSEAKAEPLPERPSGGVMGWLRRLVGA